MAKRVTKLLRSFWRLHAPGSLGRDYSSMRDRAFDNQPAEKSDLLVGAVHRLVRRNIDLGLRKSSFGGEKV